MNPRKTGAPDEHRSIVDDFSVEERILDSPGQSLDMFPPESRQTGTEKRTSVLDLGELPFRRPRAPLSTSVSTARPSRRRSVLHSVSVAGVVAASIVLALLAGATVKNRLDLSALSNYVAGALSNYVVIDRLQTPAPRQVLPAAEVVRDSATTASTSGTRESGEAIVAPPKSAVAAKKAETVRQPSASLRNETAVSRSAPPPRPAPPDRRSIERGSQPPPLAPAATATTPSAVSTVGSSPAVAATGSAPAVPSVGSASALPSVASAPAVPIVSSAGPLPSSTLAAPTSAPSPAPAPPPPPASASVAAPTRGVASATREVAAALNRYQDAFSALDVGAAHAVWPTVDVRALARAFDQLETQTFDLEQCDITVVGAQAEADCAGNARYVRKVGNKALRVEPRRWHFKLRQSNDQWLIDAVDAR